MVDIDANVTELDAKELSKEQQGARVSWLILGCFFILQPW